MNSFIQSCLDDKRAVILICVARDERAKLHVTVLKERIFAERLGYQVYKEIAVVQGSVNPLPRLFSMAQKKEIDALLMDTPESLARLRNGDLSAALRTAYEFSSLGVEVRFSDYEALNYRPNMQNREGDAEALRKYMQETWQRSVVTEYRAFESSYPDACHKGIYKEKGKGRK